MQLKTLLTRAVFTLGLVNSSMILAQTPPDAGALRQQIERERVVPLPRQVIPDRSLAPQATKRMEDASVSVKAFRFSGNTLLSNEKLAAAVAAYLKRPVSFTELQEAATAIANLYRDAGWIVRAYLPKQYVTDGIITIQIVEGVFGGIKFEGEQPLRLKLPTVLSIIGRQQKQGEPLNTIKVDRALLLADDLPGVSVAGSLREGVREGETELLLKVIDDPLLIGEGAIDNTGARSTGAQRLSFSASLNSPMQLGDQATVNALFTAGSQYGRLSYSVPVNDNGVRIGANTSTMNYRLVAKEVKASKGRGSSTSHGIDSNMPLIRARAANLYMGFAYDERHYENQANDAVTTRYAIRSGTLNLNGNLFDGLAGGGATSASVSFIKGNVDLAGSPNQAADLATTNTNGSYTKIRWALSRQQTISNNLSLYGTLSGQQASKNLDSAEKFYLGGASGVRAYPANEAGGSEARLASVELRLRLPQSCSLSSFYDRGQVTVNRDNNFAGAAMPNRYSLAGYGVSASCSSSAGANLKATLARRIGDNPNPTASGNDQDGSMTKNRIWFSASLPF